MKKIFILAALAAIVGLSNANATVTVSSTSVAGVVVVSTPSTNVITVVRGCRLCNDTSTDTCVALSDKYKSNVKMLLCAKAQTCADTPALAIPNAAAPVNGMAGFFGEQFSFAGQFIVSGSTPAALGSAGISLTCDYVQPMLHP